MTTDTESQLGTLEGVDVQSYQQFWENVPADMLTQYKGKFVALECDADGWGIVQASDDLDDLQACLAAAGADLSRIVFDRVHVEDVTAAGLEIQL
jgi:hypothetical protein